ncbi:MAG: deoxyguanosinetriphosphate triphosphohydrolase [Sporichthyaceae bacterium]
MERDEGSGPGYSASDRRRWVDEPPKRTGRSAFARDRARVLHAAALRRLGAKTQVVEPGSDDFARNRLTHSLEVGQIGRELGSWLGADADLVEAACLAHDLGHPPFGHNGEDALNAAAQACGGFEGNAQTLRVLTRLEGKAFDCAGRSVGLNLARATLDATVKYPWERRDGVRKFGAYADDVDVFTWLRDGRADAGRCLEAQVMDFADDVAYSVHDVEDGIQAGAIDLAVLSSAGDRADLAELARTAFVADLDPAEIDAAAAALTALPWWPGAPDRTRRGLAALKNMTSQLISRFCLAAESATRSLHGAGPLTRYAADLVVPRATTVEVALLKVVATRYVMLTEARVSIQARERDLVAELVAALLARAPVGLDPAFAHDFEAAPEEGARLRVVLDQVASLSDTSALAMHARLCRC